MGKLNIKETLEITLRLFIVCTLVALLVAGVNFITKDRIASLELEKTTAALGSVFGNEGVEYIPAEASLSGSVTDIYEVYRDGEPAGYGVLCSPMGFKDIINMLVAFDNDASIIAVRIISLSETKDIGDRIMSDEDFLSQFEGTKNNVVLGSGVDAISGATVSSKAALSGVNDAISNVKVYVSEKLQNAGGEA